MCIFVDEIRVSNTSIFARRRFPDENRQILVYSMKLYSNKPTAMILPIPIVEGGGEDAIRFIDLSEYENFFNDMHTACDAVRYEVETSLNGNVCFDDAPLPLIVHDVGDFEASFVPKLNDFKRLDERFQLPNGVWDEMPDYHDYGFAVFQLKPLAAAFTGSKEIHPMAFEFRSRDPERLFFPTVHVHDGKFRSRADFDHLLFMQFDDENVVGPRVTATRNQMYRSNVSERNFIRYFGEQPDFDLTTPDLRVTPIGSEEYEKIVAVYEVEMARFDAYLNESVEGFYYSQEIAKDCMKTGLARGTLDPHSLICGLKIKGELTNQDTWV